MAIMDRIDTFLLRYLDGDRADFVNARMKNVNDREAEILMAKAILCDSQASTL